jgi:hypothetical protein
VPIKIIDKGYKALMSVFTGVRKTTITVGVHAADGKEPHAGGQFGETVADIANIHEFGAPGIPQRSFLRAWFDENQAKTKEATKRMAQSVLKGKRTRKQAVNILAQSFVGQIQRRIAVGIPPPNSPLTIKLKGSSKPLIDTGQLRTSITYAIDGDVKESKASIKRKAKQKRDKKKAREQRVKEVKKKASQLFRQARKQVQRGAKKSAKSAQRAAKRAAKSVRRSIKRSAKQARRSIRVGAKTAKKVARTFRRKRRRRKS